ncbi:MAG: glutaredoxin family protein [Terriglobia bacterium]
MVQRIRIYTTKWCGDCHRAKAFLKNRDISYEEINIDETPGAAECF